MTGSVSLFFSFVSGFKDGWLSTALLVSQSLFPMLIICLWINFGFLKHCMKILFILFTEYFGAP